MKITPELLTQVQKGNKKRTLELLSDHPDRKKLEKKSNNSILEHLIEQMVEPETFDRKKHDAIQVKKRVAEASEHASFEDPDFVRTFDDILQGVSTVMEQDPNYINSSANGKALPFKQLKYNRVTSIQYLKLSNELERLGPFHGMEVKLTKTRNKEGARINIYTFDDDII